MASVVHARDTILTLLLPLEYRERLHALKKARRFQSLQQYVVALIEEEEARLALKNGIPCHRAGCDGKG